MVWVALFDLSPVFRVVVCQWMEWKWFWLHPQTFRKVVGSTRDRLSLSEAFLIVLGNTFVETIK